MGLRKIAAILDTQVIRKETVKLPSEKGRPAGDPVVIFRMRLRRYLFGVRSERRIVQESQVNVASRWT